MTDKNKIFSFDREKATVFQFENGKKLYLMPLYWRFPTKDDIICWINIDNVDEFFSNTKLMTQKNPEPLKFINQNGSKYGFMIIRTQLDNCNVSVSLRKHIAVLFACLNIPYEFRFSQKHFQVDHIINMEQWNDPEKSWNDISNLQYLSSKIHGRKTFNEMSHASRMVKHEIRKIPVCCYFSEEMKEEECERFDSHVDVCKAFENVTTVQISRACGYFSQSPPKLQPLTAKRKDTGESVTLYCRHDDENLSSYTLEQCERLKKAKEWVPLKLDNGTILPNHLISDNGIVQKPNKKFSFGTIQKGSKRFNISIQGKNVQLHILVLSSFVCPKPDDKEEWQAGHLNPDSYLDFTYKDLMWQTRRENMVQEFGGCYVKRVNTKDNNSEKWFTCAVDALKDGECKIVYSVLTLGLSKLENENDYFSPNPIPYSHFRFFKIKKPLPKHSLEKNTELIRQSHPTFTNWEYYTPFVVDPKITAEVSSQIQNELEKYKPQQSNLVKKRERVGITRDFNMDDQKQNSDFEISKNRECSKSYT